MRQKLSKFKYFFEFVYFIYTFILFFQFQPFVFSFHEVCSYDGFPNVTRFCFGKQNAGLLDLIPFQLKSFFSLCNNFVSYFSYIFFIFKNVLVIPFYAEFCNNNDNWNYFQLFYCCCLNTIRFFWDYFEYGILIGYSSMNSVKNINENFMMLC